MLNLPRQLRTSELMFFALLVALSLLIYAPCITGPFLWDENALTKNPLLQSVDGLWKLWSEPRLNRYEAHYWPFTYSVFWIQYQAWGLQTGGYHVVNIVLHAACAYLVGVVANMLGLRGSRTVALLFAAHPVHVESVAWIIELKDVLSAFLGLLFIATYFRYDRSRHGVTYVAALLAFIAALLSKSMVVTLPVCVGLILWWKRGRLTSADWLSLAPFVLLSGLFAVLDTRFAHANEAVDQPLDLATRATIPGPALWLYLWKLIVPVRLAPLYPPWNISIPVALLLLAVYVAVIVVCLLTRRRGPALALALYAVLLSPVLGLVSFAYLRHSYMADRFQYLASAPMLALAVEGLLILDGICALRCTTHRSTR